MIKSSLSLKAALCPLISMFLCAGFLSGELATQICLLDVNDTWTNTRMYREHELGDQPEKWGDPVDFQNGTFYIRLEIKEKPSDLEVMSMICLWQDGSEICTFIDSEKVIRFKEEGIYYQTFPAPGTGGDAKETGGNEDWKRPGGDHTGDYFFKPSGHCDGLLLQWWTHDEAGEWKVLRHNPSNGIHAKIDYGERVSAHIPIDYRLEIYLVAKGATFKAPSHWEE